MKRSFEGSKDGTVSKRPRGFIRNTRGAEQRSVNGHYNAAPITAPYSGYSRQSFHIGDESANGISRTLYFGNLPENLSITKLLDQITEGPIDSIKVIEEKKCAFITFIHAKSAQALHGKLASGSKKIHFGNTDTTSKTSNQGIKVGWGKPVQMNREVSNAIQFHNASRAVYIGNMELLDSPSDLESEAGSRKRNDDDSDNDNDNDNENNAKSQKSIEKAVITTNSPENSKIEEQNITKSLSPTLKKSSKNINTEYLSSDASIELNDKSISAFGPNLNNSESSKDKAGATNQQSDKVADLDEKFEQQDMENGCLKDQNMESSGKPATSEFSINGSYDFEYSEDFMIDGQGGNNDNNSSFEYLPMEPGSEINMSINHHEDDSEFYIDHEGSIDFSVHDDDPNSSRDFSNKLNEPSSASVLSSENNESNSKKELASDQSSSENSKQNSKDKLESPTSCSLTKITTKELKRQLSEFGEIEFVRTNISKKCVFVYFLSVSSAIQCVKSLPSRTGWGTPIKINYARDRCNRMERGAVSNTAHGRSYESIGNNGSSGRFNHHGSDHYIKEHGGSVDYYNQSDGPRSRNITAMYGPNMTQDGIKNKEKGNRTVYIGGLSADATIEDLCNFIRGGLVQTVKLVIEKRACFVTFLHSEDAESFMYLASNSIIQLKNRPVKVGWASHSGNLPLRIKSAVEKGATRSVYISNLPENTTVNKLKSDFGVFGEIEYTNIVKAKHTGFIHFTDISNAISTVESMRKHIAATKATTSNEQGVSITDNKSNSVTKSAASDGKGSNKKVDGYTLCRFDYAKDRCALPVRQETFSQSDNIGIGAPILVGNTGYPKHVGYSKQFEYEYDPGYTNRQQAPLEPIYHNSPYANSQVYQQGYVETPAPSSVMYAQPNFSNKGDFAGMSHGGHRSGSGRMSSGYSGGYRSKNQGYRGGSNPNTMKGGARIQYNQVGVFHQNQSVMSKASNYSNKPAQSTNPVVGSQSPQAYMGYPGPPQYSNMNDPSNMSFPQQGYMHPSQGYETGAGYSSSSISTGMAGVYPPGQPGYYYQQPQQQPPPNYAANYSYPAISSTNVPSSRPYPQPGFGNANYKMGPSQGYNQGQAQAQNYNPNQLQGRRGSNPSMYTPYQY